MDHKPPHLEKEYVRWCCVQKMLKKLHSYCKNSRHRYEAANILERWILSSANLTQSYEYKQSDEVFCDELLTVEHPINQKLIQEIVAKRLADQQQAHAILLSMHEWVKQYLVELDMMPLHTECSPLRVLEDGRVYYKKYNRQVDPHRLQILRKKGTDEHIVWMLLRYSSLLPRGQHWCIPLVNYQWLYEQYGVDIEGFASPINSQLLAVDLQCPFCSLFPDTDRVFGSVGSFFTTNFLDHSVLVNSPYMEEMIDHVARKMEQQCILAESQGSFIRFFVTTTAWYDAKGCLRMSKSKYCTYQEILPKYRHFYEDCNHTRRKRIIAPFDTAFFVLEVGENRDKQPLPNINYEKALDKMKCR
jgi:hypothetical protein